MTNNWLRELDLLKKLIEDEDEYRCTGRNETGTDSKEIFVSFPTSKCNQYSYAATRILSSHSSKTTT